LAPLRRQQQHLDNDQFPSTEYVLTQPAVGSYQQRRGTRWARIPPRPAPALSAPPGEIDRGGPEGARSSEEGALLLTSAYPTSLLPAWPTCNSHRNLSPVRLSPPTSIPQYRFACTTPGEATVSFTVTIRLSRPFGEADVKPLPVRG
jgi:hypothetical protein